MKNNGVKTHTIAYATGAELLRLFPQQRYKKTRCDNLRFYAAKYARINGYNRVLYFFTASKPTQRLWPMAYPYKGQIFIFEICVVICSLLADT